VAEAKAGSTTQAGALGQNGDEPTHIVFLIPGLLGFETFAGFSYFADRASAALRAGLESRLGTAIRVVPLPVAPLDSLADRQRHLVRTMAARAAAVSPHRTPAIHLIGHSTGGVDATLLTSDTPLSGKNWQDLERRAPALLNSIQSVITLASPHQGACIARDPLAEFLRTRSLKTLPAVARFGLSVMSASSHDPSAPDFVTGLVVGKLDSLRYLRNVVKGGALIADLQPNRTPGPGHFRADVLRRSFVTVAHCPEPGVAGSGYPDALFRDVSLRASGFTTGSTDEGARVQASVERLRRAIDANQVPIIRNNAACLPRQFEAWHNDGVVNSARQLFNPQLDDELAGIVIGDHYDVIGHYNRRVWTTNADGDEVAMSLNAGLLHSGSAFGDEEFFTLWNAMSDVIEAAAHAHASRQAAQHRVQPKRGFNAAQ